MVTASSLCLFPNFFMAWVLQPRTHPYKIVIKKFPCMEIKDHQNQHKFVTSEEVLYTIEEGAWHGTFVCCCFGAHTESRLSSCIMDLSTSDNVAAGGALSQQIVRITSFFQTFSKIICLRCTFTQYVVILIQMHLQYHAKCGTVMIQTTSRIGAGKDFPSYRIQLYYYLICTMSIVT